MMMTRDHALTLMLLLWADRPITALQLGRASRRYKKGNPVTWAELGRIMVSELLKLKIVSRHGRQPLRYVITERGRIALALYRAKRRTAVNRR